jgi:hypothetical protein
MDTDQVIQHLTENAEPVQPVSHPWVLTWAWLAAAIPYIALIVIVISPRADLATKLTETRFLIEQLAALGTGIGAAFAAFASVIPGYDRRLIFLPLLPLAVWLASLGQGCVQTLIALGPNGLSLTPDWYCLPSIVLVGMVPAIVMALLLRRGAPLTPHFTTALGGLAAAGLGNFGLRMFHLQDASLMVLVWQFGTVALLTALAGLAGGRLLQWQTLTAPFRQRLSSH